MKDQHIVYTPRGVCASEISFDVVEGRIHNVAFKGGCRGNSQGVSASVEGMKLHEVVRRLRGIDCHAGHSCPDELSRAVQDVIDQAV